MDPRVKPAGDAGEWVSAEPIRTASASVIADVPANLAAKYPIGPTGVHQDHGQQHERADQKKRLGSPGGRGLPQGEMVGNDHRVEADGDAEIRQDEEPDRARERQTWARLSSARHVTSATAAVAIGTGANMRMFGHANQRAATA